MQFRNAPNGTLFLTVRFVRTPYGNERRAFRLRASWAAAVHTSPLHEEEHTLYASAKDIADAVLRIQRSYNAASTSVDVGKAEAKLMARNGGELMAA